MKSKVTKREIVRNYKNVIYIGYCQLESLLSYENARFYTCGVYGWNSDIYPINNNTVIVTGYRPFGNITVDYDTVCKYETEAKRIVANNLKYKDSKRQIASLLNEFVSNIVGD